MSSYVMSKKKSLEQNKSACVDLVIKMVMFPAVREAMNILLALSQESRVKTWLRYTMSDQTGSHDYS
ncbi:hypothetical protein DPMN_017250 [Dreissena polymorpha]|uniref:Uncharacterized protein n=1 Tax=Dreissena polymorpha TaxID=45954 RepID=A0A9D4NB18_DREPO|nr:hypothetical protein DPMN_017250 [Dreissena polymorpha]